MDDCLFCKIANGEIPTDFVFADDNVVAFRDIAPQAPTHVLVIPRRHIATLAETGDDDTHLLGKLQRTAIKNAEAEGLEEGGYRLVVNCGEGAGQSVFHIHLHLLGGRPLSWPPG